MAAFPGVGREAQKMRIDNIALDYVTAKTPERGSYMNNRDSALHIAGLCTASAPRKNRETWQCEKWVQTTSVLKGMTTQRLLTQRLAPDMRLRSVGRA